MATENNSSTTSRSSSSTPAKKGSRHTTVIVNNFSRVENSPKTRPSTFSQRGYRSRFIGEYSLLRFVFLILLAVTVLALLRGSANYLTFESFLTTLQNAPQVDLSWINSLDTWLDMSWDLVVDLTFFFPGWYVPIPLNWLKSILDFFMPIIKVLVFLCSGLYQLLEYVIAMFNLIFV